MSSVSESPAAAAHEPADLKSDQAQLFGAVFHHSVARKVLRIHAFLLSIRRITTR